MKVRFKEHIVSVYGCYHPGEEVDIKEAFAADMINAKYAEALEEPKKTRKPRAKKPAPEPEEQTVVKPEEGEEK